MKKNKSEFLIFVLVSSLFITLITFTFFVRSGLATIPKKSSAAFEANCPLGTAPVRDCTRILKRGNKCFWRCEPERLIPSPIPVDVKCPWIICPTNCATEIDDTLCNSCKCPL